MSDSTAPSPVRGRGGSRVRHRVLALIPLLAACGAPTPEPAVEVRAEGRSIVFILIDTLREDHTSIVEHRHGRSTTPFLRSLAAESIVFRRAYAPASWTRASMASIFTSRLPGSHGCETRDGLIADELVTWAEVLSDHGYATRGVITNGNILDRYGFAQGFDEYRHVKDFPRNVYADAMKVREPVLETIDAVGDAPYLLYLHYVDPHDPYMPHDDATFDPDYEGPLDGSRQSLDPWHWSRPEDPDVMQRFLDLYDGDILWFDRELERLFAKLERRGVLDEAWIVITSDHGEGMWDHRIQAHGQEVYEEQIHVPLVVRPPGGLDVATRVEQPISLIDVAPTILDFLDIPIPQDFEGMSWAPFLEQQGEAPARPVVIEEKLDNVHFAAIIDGDDKLIIEYEVTKGQPPGDGDRIKSVHLYDLDSNPEEDVDDALDARSERSAKAARLERMLLEAREEARSRRPTAQGGELELSPEEIAQLEAMGYLGGGVPDESAPKDDEESEDGDGDAAPAGDEPAEGAEHRR